LLVSSDNPNLFFLPGDGKTPFMANMAYAQKIKLISRIRKPPAHSICNLMLEIWDFNALQQHVLQFNLVLLTQTSPFSFS
jgi:hypothetical protein